MSNFTVPSKKPKTRFLWLAGISITVMIVLGGAYQAYRYLKNPESNRWLQYRAYLHDRSQFDEKILRPGMRCGDAPFAFPTTGVIFGLWDQSYRPGHRHSGVDIFAGTEPGVTPVYAVYPGYLSRGVDWLSTVIIRHPSDPLQPGRQIWTYYTHMASEDGKTSFVSPDFPPGTEEVFVEAGTFLGYQGNYSGTPNNPTGLHLHFSIVKDDGYGNFLNELDIENTYDPSPYFNLMLNQNDNPDGFPICDTDKYFEDWELVAGDE